MKKKFGLFLPVLMLLASCGGSSYYGTYSFQLGKSNSTHIGIFMDLKDEDNSDVTDAKNFDLRFDIDSDGSSSSSATESTSAAESSSEASLEGSESSEEEASTEDIIGSLQDFISNDMIIHGYYIIDYSTEGSASGMRVYIGLNLFDEVLEGESITIPPEMMEKFVDANIVGNTLNLNFPVSLTDLYYQLYWYGYRVDVANLTFDELETAHEIGTHPTADDIKAIQEYESGLENPISMFCNYRDFHVLKMGLTKGN